LDQIFAIFGTSSGDVEFHKINFAKKRLEMSLKSTISLSGSVLCMKRIKVDLSKSILVVGMSSGNIAILDVHFVENELHT
jgi:hypothetical protein